ncbi:hypothetical protein CERZMDRAFT_82143 [Cercospora zeae-maydis SCOH1-5]|uniref:Uncharacterized protein n=1 Tax=Cercospora zeae-maydis SCOH1-5 TaxID=717836 RepID=A0A6A6FRJ2_9PEZI|nr:hypothetical protein CERZMDRAFT_82143 [Cercospora zeae-maydis SCOH1-5]
MGIPVSGANQGRQVGPHETRIVAFPTILIGFQVDVRGNSVASQSPLLVEDFVYYSSSCEGHVACVLDDGYWLLHADEFEPGRELHSVVYPHNVPLVQDSLPLIKLHSELPIELFCASFGNTVCTPVGSKLKYLLARLYYLAMIVNREHLICGAKTDESIVSCGPSDASEADLSVIYIESRTSSSAVVIVQPSSKQHSSCRQPESALRMAETLHATFCVPSSQRYAPFALHLRADVAMPDVVKKQTIKQAKASFKARGRPTLTEKESRQLQRALELEERADRAREAEKRRLEAAKKRSEREKREQAQGKQQIQLGTQRRCDRFGYKSSQYHLGAFFRKQATESRGLVEATRQYAQEAFEDDGLDDASLLMALNAAPRSSGPASKPPESDASLMPPPPLPPAAVTLVQARLAEQQEDFSDLFDSLDSSTQIAKALDSPSSNATSTIKVLDHAAAGARSSATTARAEAFHADSPTLPEDMSDFFGELASGTQIARELEDGVNQERRSSNASSSSFSSGSLDLTIEDVAMIDSANSLNSPSLASTASWPKPSKSSGNIMHPSGPDRHVASVSPGSRAITRARTNPRAAAMPPPALPSKVSRASITSPTPVLMKQKVSCIRGPFLSASNLYCSPDLGFTSTQLESFIEDDLQLTQVS